MEAIQRMVSTGMHVEPCPYLEVGQRVRIEDGALSGLEGVLTSLKGSQRIVVSISLLRRSVALEIDRCAVSVVQPKHSCAGQSRLIVPSFEPVVA